MRFVVAVTNNSWFAYLRARAMDEVNFWSPGTAAVNLAPGTLWLFKLHAPVNCVVGGGYFVHRTQLPLRMAWDTFGEENGAPTYDTFRKLIGKDGPGDVIGCTVLSETFYWPEELWLPSPPNWSKNIVSNKRYDANAPAIATFWQSVVERLPPAASLQAETPVSSWIGKPVLRIPRLGQGGFRAQIIDAYARRCAVTGERTLPALEAAHIVPFAETQNHDLRNGLLLRADLHKLFDDGYVTVDPTFHFHVSRRIKDEFENGRDYYALHGREIGRPADTSVVPDPQYLEAHATRIYKG